jgi:GTP cyclohydrolase I
VDRASAERAIAQFLRALGYDPETDPELAATPERVTTAFADELLVGRHVDVAALILSGSSPNTSTEQDCVAVRDIAVATMCPHHLLPAMGTAFVAYVPGERLLGLGTIASLLNAYARRLTLQETIARGVVDALMTHGGARGASCRIELAHSCFAARGERQAGASVVTLARAGCLATEAATAVLAQLGHNR